MQTDNLAAQMVREMFGECGYEYSEKAFVDANIDIARRYIEKALTAQAEEIERLRATVRRVQSAAKTIMHHEGDELARLRKQAQEHHLAVLTLDSEREANSMLTEEVEQLQTTGNALVEAIERASPRLMDMESVYQNHGFPPPLPEHRFADQFEAFRAALKAAQEVGR